MEIINIINPSIVKVVLLTLHATKAAIHKINIVRQGLFLIKSVTGLIVSAISLSIVDMSANIGVVKRITENRMNILNII